MTFKKSKTLGNESISRIIPAIEQSFDVNSVKYQNLMVWPLIRLTLIQQLIHPEMNFTRKNSQPAELPLLHVENEQLELLSRYNNIDILFFSRSEEHEEQIQEKFYNPYLDPMIDLVKSNYSFLKIERLSNEAQKTLPRFESTMFINPKLMGYRTDSARFIGGFSDLQKVIGDIAGICIDEALYIEQARWMKAWQSFFTKLLSVIRPKAVFFVYFNYLIAMSLVWACKRSDIKTVDIQHGLITDNSIQYIRWMKIPQDGYDQLPDYYWCWGRPFQNNIEKWYMPESSHHVPVTGGNVRIAKWMQSDDYIINDKIKDFYRYLKQFDKVILITLQTLSPEMSLPEYVFEAIQRAPRNWLWLMRLHPLYRSEVDKNRIIAFAQKYDIRNYEIEYATACPLYGLLKRCNYHVTGWSSTVYEALAFHVPSTVVHSNGLCLFENEIKRGIFNCAYNSDELLTSIMQSFSKNIIEPQVKYIETSRECAEDALQIVLNSSLQNAKDRESVSFENKKRNYASLMNELGLEFFKSGYIKAALNTFSRAVEINPDFAIALNNLAVLYLQAGKKDKALQYFTKALELAPDNRNIVSNVIEFLKIVGNMKAQGNMLLLF